MHCSPAGVFFNYPWFLRRFEKKVFFYPKYPEMRYSEKNRFFFGTREENWLSPETNSLEKCEIGSPPLATGEDLPPLIWPWGNSSDFTRSGDWPVFTLNVFATVLLVDFVVLVLVLACLNHRPRKNLQLPTLASCRAEVMVHTTPDTRGGGIGGHIQNWFRKKWVGKNWALLLKWSGNTWGPNLWK